LRLSLAAWKSLPLDARRAITDAGSEREVDLAQVRASVKSADPAAEPMAPSADPAPDAPSEEVRRVFGSDRPVSDAVWVALSPLDRYAVAKVAKSARPERVAAAHSEIVGASALSTHLAASGEVRMVDVGEKKTTLRRAKAESFVRLGTEAFERLRDATASKGDVLATARLAGIMAAKRTPEWIPLCHQVALTRVSVDLAIEPSGVRIRSEAEAVDRTGVEMEALVAASAAALTVYDMLKAYDRAIEIGPTRLLEKSGGRSGDYRR
jgi:cyclic pyranopterin phosphate synthase